jgi:succinoglycan biosynthesis transport protein ExoP
MAPSEHIYRSQPPNGYNGHQPHHPGTAVTQTRGIPALTQELSPPLSETAWGRLIRLLSEHPGFVLLAALYRAIRKRPLVAITGAVLLNCLAFITVWYLLPPSLFVARALLRYDLVPSGFLDSPRDQFYTSNWATFQKTQQALIRSQPVLSATLRAHEVRDLALIRSKSDPLAYLEREITADFALSPEIMRISMTGQDAQALETIVNAVVRCYLEEFIDKEHKQLLNELSRTEELTSCYAQRITEKQARLRQLEEKLTSGNSHSLDSLAKNYLDQVERYRKELASQLLQQQQLSVECDSLVQRLSLIRMLLDKANHFPWYLRLSYYQLLSAIIPDSQVNSALQQEPLLQERLAELHKVQAELEAAEKLLAPNIAPAMKELLLKSKRDSLMAVQAELDSTIANLRPVVQRRLLEKIASESEQRLTELQDKLSHISSYRNHISEEIQTLEKALTNLHLNRTAVQSLKDEIETDLQTYKKLLARKEQLDMVCRTPPRVTVLESAHAVPAYESKKRGLYLFIAMSLSAFLWICGLLAWEWRTQHVYRPQELLAGLPVPVVGLLPDIGPVGSKKNAHCEHPTMLDINTPQCFAEAIDTLRVLLTHHLGSASHSVLMVTSALHGEGKTMLSFHLAASLARCGNRVLLMDADFSRSNTHRLISAKSVPGLAEILCGQHLWRDAIQRLDIPNLDFLAAGKYDHFTCYKLGQAFTRIFLDDIRLAYDFIIIDTSPVLSVADVLGLASFSHGVLLTVSYRRSSLVNVRLAYQRLTTSGARVLGTVMNRLPVRLYSKYSGAAWTASYLAHEQYSATSCCDKQGVTVT